MDDFSVGDFAEQILKEQRESPKVPSPSPVSPASNFITEQPLDISDVEIPSNFLEVISEGKELELTKKAVSITEDKAALADEIAFLIVV